MENTNTQLPIIGKTLPDFELEAYLDNKIQKIKLSDYKGKWLVLFFYPADFTFVCPTELQELAESYNEFKSLDAEILSISTDTVFVHKAWHDNSPAIKQIKFPMVADPTAKLCRELNTYIPEDGLSLRATVIVDPEGKIKVYEIHDNSIGRSTQELLRKITAAKFVSEHSDQVCPASWKPGKDTLTPGLDLVGKI